MMPRHDFHSQDAPETVRKTYKTFLATYKPACGVIRVVQVTEDEG